MSTGAGAVAERAAGGPGAVLAGAPGAPGAVPRQAAGAPAGAGSARKIVAGEAVALSTSPPAHYQTQNKHTHGADKVVWDYKPQARQIAFHQAAQKYRCYLGAWRSGKTHAGCEEAIIQSLAFPGNIGLIGRKDYTDLRDTTIRSFFELCPEKLIRTYNKTEHHLYLVNGSEIYFRELKDGAGLGSLNLGWFWVDEAEEIAETIFDRLQGRLSLTKSGRQCGWLTSNPPNKDHWIYRRFVDPGSNDCYLIHCKTYDNSEHLPEDYIANLERMPESWRKKYLFGEFGFTPDGKPFYDGFDEKIHRRKLQYDPTRKMYRGIDFGYHHPACVWVQIDKFGRIRVLSELMGTEVTIDRFADQIIAFENQRFPGVLGYETYYDPSGVAKNDKNERTSVEVLASKGIAGRGRQSTYRQRKELIEKRLTTLIKGEPGMTFDESCQILTDGFMGGYHYPVAKEGKAVREEPFRDGYYEHSVNALEYIIINICSVVEDSRGEEDYVPAAERFRR